MFFRPSNGKFNEGESSEQALLHARQYRFIIQQAFSYDYTEMDPRYHTTCTNTIDSLITNFTMPSELEFKFLEYLSLNAQKQNEQNQQNDSSSSDTDNNSNSDISSSTSSNETN